MLRQSFPVKGATFTPSNPVYLGAMRLSRGQIHDLASAETRVDLYNYNNYKFTVRHNCKTLIASPTPTPIAPGMRCGVSKQTALDEYRSGTRGYRGPGALQLHDGCLQSGNVYDPAIGDVRICFSAAAPTDGSIIGKAQGYELVPFTTSNGRTIMLVRRLVLGLSGAAASFHSVSFGALQVEPGLKTADQLFSRAEASNTLATWGLRFVGFLLMFIGLSMIMEPLRIAPLVNPRCSATCCFVPA